MKIHIVKKGESLYGLSQKYGVELDKLIAANPQITDPNVIDVGQKVKIPHAPKPVAPPPTDYLYKHVVVQGDSLWKLGKAWGVPLADMIAANPQLKNPNVLMTGDVVYIPKPGSNPNPYPPAAPQAPLPVEASPISELPLAPNVGMPNVGSQPEMETPHVGPLPNLGIPHVMPLSNIPQPNVTPLSVQPNIPQPNVEPFSVQPNIPQPNVEPFSVQPNIPQPNVMPFSVQPNIPQPNVMPFSVQPNIPQPNVMPFSVQPNIPQPNVEPFSVQPNVPPAPGKFEAQGKQEAVPNVAPAPTWPAAEQQPFQSPQPFQAGPNEPM
ncbi:LysM peptidoglycan-binding domain-containing protein, partial [Paenibacillus ehimensis]